jgi:alpha-glucosidase
MRCVKYAAITGEPILRSMEYSYPHCGFEKITDQFLLGEELLVAPVIEQGATERSVVLPEGKWYYLGKEVLDGGKTVVVNAPLGVLPYFTKKSK